MNIFTPYKKALKVIDSCTNPYHLEGARKYINLFFLSNTTKEHPTKFGIKVYDVDDLIAKMYNRLLVSLLDKEQQVNG